MRRYWSFVSRRAPSQGLLRYFLVSSVIKRDFSDHDHGTLKQPVHFRFPGHIDATWTLLKNAWVHNKKSWVHFRLLVYNLLSASPEISNFKNFAQIFIVRNMDWIWIYFLKVYTWGWTFTNTFESNDTGGLRIRFAHSKVFLVVQPIDIHCDPLLDEGL